MAKTTGIEWTNATYNPWHGCHKVSDGCDNCYMFRDKARYGQDGNIVVRSGKSTFNAPLHWKEPKRIFTCSWSDFFIKEADEWRDEAWDIIRRTPHHTYQILTKRPARIKSHLPADWGEGYPNVWLGVSVENQFQAVRRIPLLNEIPAAIRFLSCEPLLGPLDLYGLTTKGISNQNMMYGYQMIHWVITGGESGSKDKIRPANIQWFKDIRGHCQMEGIAYFHKQHGGNTKINGIWGGRELDGRTWSEFPETVEVAQ